MSPLIERTCRPDRDDGARDLLDGGHVEDVGDVVADPWKGAEVDLEEAESSDRGQSFGQLLMPEADG